MSLSYVFESASHHLRAQLELRRDEEAHQRAPGDYAGIIFSGNPHETVPRRLLLDQRLTPLERNAWQVFRLLINSDGITAFPTYEQLRPYLGMQPGKPASRETVAKALTVLRLTRWLSLGRKVRDEINGQVQGNVYMLHDEPTSPAEAIELDRDYMQLLGHSLQHANRAIRDIAERTWKELTDDPDVGERLPTRLDGYIERITAQPWIAGKPETAPEHTEFGIRTKQKAIHLPLRSESELSENSASNTLDHPSSDSELSGKPGSSDSVRIPNSYSTYVDTNQFVSKNVPHAREHSSPPATPPTTSAFDNLTPENRHKAIQAIRNLPDQMQDQVVRQWTARCNDGAIANPMAYLLTLVQKALSGKLNEWSPRSDGSTEKPVPTPIAPAPIVHSAPPLPRRSNGMQTGNEALRALNIDLGRRTP